jgi:NAD(P)-dependent dehydrogenase (short-subunit alcohol dehydrogenase family)
VDRPHPEGEPPCGLETLQQEVEAEGPRFLQSHTDIADLDRHGAMLSTIVDRFGRLDLFVSNAGIAPDPRRDVLEMTPESFDRVLAVNLRGAVFLAQRVARVMVSQSAPKPGCGRAVIFITSVSAERSSPDRFENGLQHGGASSPIALRPRASACSRRAGITRTAMTAGRRRNARLIGGGLVPEGRWANPTMAKRPGLARGDFDYRQGNRGCRRRSQHPDDRAVGALLRRRPARHPDVRTRLEDAS